MVTLSVTLWLAWTSTATPMAVLSGFANLALRCALLCVEVVKVARAQGHLVAIQVARLVIYFATLAAARDSADVAVAIMAVALVDAVVIAPQEVGMTLPIPTALEKITAFGVTITKIRLA